MYLSFYNFTSKPFPEKTEPNRLLLNDDARNSLATFKEHIINDRGILLLTGDVGVGKTSFIERLVLSLPDNFITGNVINSGLTQLEFAQLIAKSFNLTKKFPSLDEFLEYFTNFLISSISSGKRMTLVIDEAQHLTRELLYIVERLGDLEDNNQKLLNIILVGQNDFNTILFLKENNTLRKLVSTTYNISQLSEIETEQYVKAHLVQADGDENIFSPEAIHKIFKFSNGSPRLINLLCDLSLLNGFINKTPVISGKTVADCMTTLLLPNERTKDFLPVAEQRAQEFWGTFSKSQRQKPSMFKTSVRMLLLFVLLFFGSNYILQEMQLPSITEFVSNEIKSNRLVKQIKETTGAPDTFVLKEQSSTEATDITIAQDKPEETATIEQVPQEKVAEQIIEIELPQIGRVSSPEIEKIVSEIHLTSRGEEKSNNPQNIPDIPEDEIASVTPPNIPTKDVDQTNAASNEVLTLEENKAMEPPVIVADLPASEEVQIPAPQIKESPAPPLAETNIVVTQHGNVRREPSIESKIIAVASRGSEVQNLRQVDDWIYIKLGNGQLGWMHQSLFSVQIAPKNNKKPLPPSILQEETASLKQVKRETEQRATDEKVAPALQRKESSTLQEKEILPQAIPKPPSTITPSDSTPRKETLVSGTSPVAVEKVRAKANNPEAVTWSQKSFTSASQGEFAKAVTEASQAIYLDPDLIDPYINRAWAYSEIGEHKKAIADGEVVITLDPKNAAAFNNLGLAYQRMGDFTKAQEYYAKSCEMKLTVACKNLSEVNTLLAERRKQALEWSQKSYVSATQGEFVKAITEASQAISLEPDFVDPYINRAWAYSEIGNQKMAIADGEFVVTLDPFNAANFNNMGLAYQRMRDFSKAQEYYAKSCEMKLTVACSNLKEVITLIQTKEKEEKQRQASEWAQKSYTSASRGDYVKAIREASEAIAIDPDFVDAYLNRAWAYSEIGAQEKALADGEIVAALDPDNAAAFNNMGLAYQRMGHFPKAKKYYAKSCDMMLEVACRNLNEINTLLQVSVE